MSEESKNNIIKNIYFGKSGFGSVQSTYQKANQQNDNIRIKDVKDWFFKNVQEIRKPKINNSFINDEAYDEYQIDLIFFGKDKTDDKTDNKKDVDKPALSMIDIFSKYAVVIPMASKLGPSITSAVMEGMNKMNPDKKPNRIYSDNEKGFIGPLAELAEELNIKLYVTKHSAMVNERFNRTFKDMIWKRLKASKKPISQWKEFIPEVLDVYNNQMVSSATGMTPAEARKKENTLQVKVNLEMRRNKTRKYPELDVGDHVKVFFKKRTQNKKENVSNWSDKVYKIERTSESFGQTYYHLENQTRSYLRHDLLKVPGP